VNDFAFTALIPERAGAGRIEPRSRVGLLRVVALAATGSVVAVGPAFAQAASTAGSLGAQLNSMSSEAIDSGGTALGMVCYVLAMFCFVGGAWALWQSRQPQHRESGYVAKGAAGLVICGLLVMMPQWINKSAHTVGGADATINNTPAQVKFAP
jgi:hypothetical protein